jgi:ligand-binding SRPBCC domain-containing protein
MKVTTLNIEPAFTPFSCTITFESQREADTFYQILNAVPICEWAENHGFSAEEIRNVIRGRIGEGSPSELVDNLRRRFQGVQS